MLFLKVLSICSSSITFLQNQLWKWCLIWNTDKCPLLGSTRVRKWTPFAGAVPGYPDALFHTHFICCIFFWRISIKLSSCVFILYRVGRQRITAPFPPFWNLFRSTIDHNSVEAYVSALKMLLHGTYLCGR